MIKNNNIEIIEKFMKENNGYITSKEVKKLGIHRMYLKIMLDRKIIEKVNRGIYISSNIFEIHFLHFN